MVFSIAQTLFAKGAEEKAEETVIVVPFIELIILVSTEPSGKTTDNVAEFSVVRSVLFASSTTTVVVLVTDFLRPPLHTPALKESAVAIIVDGLTITPASSVVVNETTSDSFKLEYKNQRPNLLA